MHKAIARVGKGTQSFHALSLWNLDVSPSQHIIVFTNQEASPGLCVQSFYWGCYYIGTY